VQARNIVVDVVRLLRDYLSDAVVTAKVIFL
jgi:hypothetical protein